LAVISRWLPDGYQDDKWQTEVRKIGQTWASSWRSKKKDPPKTVRGLWREVAKNADLSLDRLGSVNYSEVAASKAGRANRVCRALLEVMAIADEACLAIGIPDQHGDFAHGGLEEAAIMELYRQFQADKPSTLCRSISPAKLSVLPKLHTPQTGTTIRSFSNHLALCFGSEVRVSWVWGRPLVGSETRHGLNVVVIPWPDLIVPADFAPVAPKDGRLAAMTALERRVGQVC